MLVCRVCKQENEEHFTYCKNCGTELEKPKAQSTIFNNYNNATPTYPQYNQQNSCAPVVNKTPEAFELVGVYMRLPDIDNPSIRTLQKVYVTKQQYAAMKAAGMFGENKSE